MAASQELVIQLRLKAEALKAPYMDQFREFDKTADPERKKELLQRAHEAGLRYFNAYESMVQDSGLLGAYENKQWVVDAAGTCHTILESVLSHYRTIREACKALGLEFKHYKPNTMAYSAMQRMVAAHLGEEKATSLSNRFKNAGLPVEGFNAPPIVPEPSHALSPEPVLEPEASPPIAKGFFAVGCLVTVVAIGFAIAAFAKGTLTDDQRWVLRQWTYMTIGFAAGSFSGGLVAKNKGWIPGLALTATGGFAGWLLAHYFDQNTDQGKRAVTIELVTPAGSALNERVRLDVRYDDEPRDFETKENGTVSVAVPPSVSQIRAIYNKDPRYDLETVGPYPIVTGTPIRLTMKPKAGISPNLGPGRRAVTILLMDERDQPIREEMTLTVRFGEDSRDIQSSKDGTASVAIPEGFTQIDHLYINGERYEVVKPGPYPVVIGQPITVTLKQAGKPEARFTNTIGMEFALIPAGEFQMGPSKAEDEDAWDNEMVRGQKHLVRIPAPFYLGVTEVTQGQYRALTNESPSNFKGSDDLPVETVSWRQALDFCDALSDKEKLPRFYKFDGQNVDVPDWKAPGYRLPTEAEWEYACRANNPARYNFGGDAAGLGAHAWFDGNSGNKTNPVRRKPPNAFGLHDMHGNDWEWCFDGYQTDFYASSRVDNPVRLSEGAADRVVRGGGWSSIAQYAWSASRYGYAPGDRLHYLGFRVARGQSGSR